MDAALKAKYEKLNNYLSGKQPLAVAFSAGVDSTFLLKAAHDVLGDGVVAVTAKPYSFPDREYAEAEAFCKAEGIRQLTARVNEFEIEGYSQNPPNRCYLCKKTLFSRIMELAKEAGAQYIAEGSNMDDLGDYRPGLQAIKELQVLSPLREAGLYKQDIRDLSRQLGLPTWEKPSYACLATRFVYGEEITPEKIGMVDRAEQLLLDLGFRQMRVRVHGDLARIEVPEQELARLMSDEVRTKVYDSLQEYGFRYISADLKGYRTGSMNEVLAGGAK